MNNAIQHPCCPSRKLYFLADVPHLFNNIKASLVNDNVFVIPSDVAEREKLPSKEVSIQPVKELADFQLPLDLKLAPKLAPSLLEPSHFNKMKVGEATRVVSHEVSAALLHLVETEGKDESYRSTAWFLAKMRRWFDLLTSRCPLLALSHMNPKEHQAAVDFLKSMVLLFQDIGIGKKPAWKPCQTGLILSTSSILQISKSSSTVARTL